MKFQTHPDLSECGRDDFLCDICSGEFCGCERIVCTSDGENRLVVCPACFESAPRFDDVEGGWDD